MKACRLRLDRAGDRGTPVVPGNREGEIPHMTIEAQSERIVEIASMVLAAACLVMAWGVLSTLLARARNRVKRRGDQAPREVLFLAEPQKPPASPIDSSGQPPGP
jgi:hypothetical protein